MVTWTRLVIDDVAISTAIAALQAYEQDNEFE